MHSGKSNRKQYQNVENQKREGSIGHEIHEVSWYHHQKTNPYTLEQNYVLVSFNRTVVAKARYLLFEANLNKCFWAETIHTVEYLKNRAKCSLEQQCNFFSLN